VIDAAAQHPVVAAHQLLTLLTLHQLFSLFIMIYISKQHSKINHKKEYD
jgi:hypothetical protein